MVLRWLVMLSLLPASCSLAGDKGAPGSVYISPQELEEGFRPLFNGMDTSGWKVYRGLKWKVVDGCLVGPRWWMGWIGTEEEFSDFVLRLEYWIDRWITPESNSGIFFRADPHGGSKDRYEMQISLQSKSNPTGSIYGLVPTDLKKMRKIAPERHWNSVEIYAKGPHIRITINGVLVQDCVLHRRSKGVIGLQQHHPGVKVMFRNIRIKVLDPTTSGNPRGSG
jgi:hypothetical protein